MDNVEVSVEVKQGSERSDDHSQARLVSRLISQRILIEDHGETLLRESSMKIYRLKDQRLISIEI